MFSTLKQKLYFILCQENEQQEPLGFQTVVYWFIKASLAEKKPATRNEGKTTLT